MDNVVIYIILLPLCNLKIKYSIFTIHISYFFGDIILNMNIDNIHE